MLDVDALLDAFRGDLAHASTPDDIEKVRKAHLSGGKSAMKVAFKDLRTVDAASRREVAASLNAAKKTIEDELEAAKGSVAERALAQQIASEWQDLTLPDPAPARGARHPVAQVERTALTMLRQLGFVVVDGPEVEHPYYCFDALNIPEHHPARDMQDTFYVTGGWLLRSHTTTVQARVLGGSIPIQPGQAKDQRPTPPFRVASLGRVYRNEAVDNTHLANFHQFEGIWVEPGLTFAHLKGTLAFVARTLFGDQHEIRFKPKFYPYTEPSVGMDLSCGTCGGTGKLDGAPCPACHGAGWITVLGAGMVHPNVFAEFGYDPSEVSGIAFGLGTTRFGAQWGGVDALLPLYQQDLRVHHQLYRGRP
ncbi:MAG: phenylalanine--tRNA ligase subunit alpha [Myxococcota bacterium]